MGDVRVSMLGGITHHIGIYASFGLLPLPFEKVIESVVLTDVSYINPSPVEHDGNHTLRLFDVILIVFSRCPWILITFTRCGT